MTLCGQDQGYENLANAIVADAAQEYMMARKSLDRRKSKFWQERKESCLRFFYSDWFRTLTNLEPDALIGTLDREYANGRCIDGLWVFGETGDSA